MKLSIQLYTVRKELDADLGGTLQKLADLGLQYVEPYNFAATADALGAALRDTGLQAPSGHAPLLSGNQDEIFAAAKALGITTVIDPHVPVERWKDPADIAETAAALNAAAAKGAEHGITVGYHNHWWEAEAMADGRTGIEVLAEHLDPTVVLELDTYWAAVGGSDPVELMKRLGSRVRFIHIKDGPVTSDPTAQLAVGAGKMPIWDIVNAASALEAGVIELDDFAGNMLDAVAASFTYLNSGKGQA